MMMLMMIPKKQTILLYHMKIVTQLQRTFLNTGRAIIGIHRRSLLCPYIQNQLLKYIVFLGANYMLIDLPLQIAVVHWNGIEL